MKKKGFWERFLKSSDDDDEDSFQHLNSIVITSYSIHYTKLYEKGSLIPAAAKDSSKTEKSESIMEGLRPPWEEPEPESVTEQQTPEYDLPDPQPDIAIQTDNFWNSTKAFIV